MTQKVQAAMLQGNGVIHYEIKTIAAGATASFRPILASPRALKITSFNHVLGAFESGDAPTVKLQTGTPGSWTDVSLTGGTDNPAMATSINLESTDSDGGSFSSSSSNYVAAGEGINLVIDYGDASTTAATDIIVEIYATVVD